MNKYNLFKISAISGLLFFGACEQGKKEKIPISAISNASLIPSTIEAKTVSGIQAKEVNKLAGLTPSKLTEIAKTSKRIPFQEMLKANVTFTQNKGQLERFENFYIPEIGAVQFYSKAFCGNAFFGKQGIGYSFQRMGLRDADFYINGTEKEKLSKAERRETIGFTLQFENSNVNTFVSGINQQQTKMNFMKGNNPDAFVTDVSSYEKIQYNELYQGIDLLYYNSHDQLKYDFIVAPKADVNQIRMKYNQVNKVELNKKGELEIKIQWGTLVDKKPYSYQVVNGKQKEVSVKYKLIDSLTVGFEIHGNYDPSKELIIDPYTVAWSTYVGTATSDDGYLESTCMDNTGRTLGTGWTNNSFPIAASANGYNKIYSGGTEAFVFRLNGTGTALDYVTYLGGSSNEVGTGIAVNAAGEICVAGHTASYLQTTFVENSPSTLTVATGPMNVTVANIGVYGNPENLVLVNGTNVIYGFTSGFPNGTTITLTVTSVIGSGSFTGWQVFRLNQLPFPVTAGAIQPTKTGNDGNDDLFYVKLNGAGNNLIYGTYYGGTASLPDWAIDMALDATGNAYITGRTQTTTGFATSGVYKTTAQGGYDGFVLKITNTNTLGYCTYVGGPANDICKGIVSNSAGEVFVSGMTGSTGQATVGAFQTVHGGADDAFVAKLTSTGAIAYFTYLGGAAHDGACGIDLAVASNEIVVTGTTLSNNFPMLNAFDNSLNGRDGFLTRINAAGSALVYSTYIGGDGSDNGKGFDYSTIHKFGGVKLSAGELPIMVFGMNSTSASMASYLISPITFNTVNQSGGATTHNGATYSGNDDWFITVMDATAQNCLFGMYMGGTDNDYPTAGLNIDLTSACITFGGGVHSLPFPVTPGAFQTTRVNSSTPDQSTVAKICLNEILPVEFFYFNVIESNGNGLLKWGTSSEENNDYFEIQKSTDGKTFYTIGKVDGNGTTNETSHYNFVDENLTVGTTYYRIKQVDSNGEIHYSVIKSLAINAFGEIVLAPNPGNGIFAITAQVKADAIVEISVLNILSEEVYGSSEAAPEGVFQKSIELSNLASGVYLVQVKAGVEQKTIRYIKE
jgi:hypothetical protein